MKTLTAILFAFMIAFSGSAVAALGEGGGEGEWKYRNDPFPQSDPNFTGNDSVNCEDRCIFDGYYPPSDPNDTSNDLVNAEK